MHTPKTVVFGLDGAHFELITPWVESGELPNVRRVLSEGISGDLESVLPPVTSPNWKAYATGKNPGKLGIFWWENIDTDEQRVSYPSHRKHIHEAYWDHIGRKESAGVLGVPTTHPASPVNGFLVSGAPDGENRNYAYPPSVEAELNEQFDYRVTKRHQLKDQRDAAVEEILALIDQRFEAAKHLCQEFEPAFLQVTTFYINSLHHYLWDDDATLEAWRIVDQHLGDYLDNETNIVLMSDHGSTEIETVFNINTWLAEQGYLELDNQLSRGLLSLGINRDRIGKVAGTLNLRNFAAEHTPQWVLDHLPASDGTVNRESKMRNVHWDESVALASGQGPVYLLLNRDDERYNRLRDEIRTQLESLTDTRGRSVVETVHDREDVYHGQYLDEAPDLIIEQADGVHISGAVGHEEIFTTTDATGWQAENKLHGLFAAHGPSFTTGQVADLSILDLAPTLLHLHGLPVPSDMDGEVRIDVFDGESAASQRTVERRTMDRQSAELGRIRDVAQSLDGF
ncbi:alkaline phosphatase family protein [Halorientalis regularis]|uniref:Predicted phosphohydrolase or phosphomutase, AlkP superfamily n=1 Tax=Halorientalis regularis TaxID=660518 RepID=A0A1G7T346_9EURY|nr:alkaline phosphatase family protein [Halorientalis regularis]SDG29695.1 Predicted phosphohydrolase or phosphomutase, AlkP superfamily [Halorientalis regularis]